MNRFTIREIVGGVLIPLIQVVNRLPAINYQFVVFKDMRFTSGLLLGLPVPDFERLSRDFTGGFVIAKQDFERVLTADVQVRDGIVEFVGMCGLTLLRIECVDASQWDISTEQADVLIQLEKSGLSRKMAD
jgi:hypothetical protein